jgi:hypothetical protein
MNHPAASGAGSNTVTAPMKGPASCAFRSFVATAAALACFAGSVPAQQTAPAKPMQPEISNGAEYRQLRKKVLRSRLLDGMEDLTHWSFAGVGSMTLSTAEVRQGRTSLRVESADNIGRVQGSGDWQDLVATRNFPSENWSAYNRISVWVR